MNHKQLTFVREFRGYSQTELSKQIKGLSQSNLSKFEKGMSSLSEDLQNKIISFLGFPADFYDRKINTFIENANYRKRATITKSKVTRFENKCKIIGYLIDELSEALEWPDFTLSPLNVEDGYTPEHIANYTRRLLGIDANQPIRNIFSKIESSGVITYEIDEEDKFDGVSFITDKGFAVIIVNKNFSNDRKRFTLAHELGHILMHNENNFPISSFRDKEKEANRFASEFLMPESSIKNSLRNLKMNELASLKNYWLTSMSSLIRRSRDLGTIDANRYKYFLIEMSRNGFTKKEPIEVFIDKPTCFKNAVKIFKDELAYSVDDFSQYTALPRDITQEFFNDNRFVKLRAL